MLLNCREASEARAAATHAEKALEVARGETQRLEAVMEERQKRFMLLNGGFKKKEDALKDQLEAAMKEAESAKREAVAAVAEVDAAQRVRALLAAPAVTNPHRSLSPLLLPLCLPLHFSLSLSIPLSFMSHRASAEQVPLQGCSCLSEPDPLLRPRRSLA
jgi:hypothetical protein